MSVETLRCGSTLTTFRERCEALQQAAYALRARALALGPEEDALFQRIDFIAQEVGDLFYMNPGNDRIEAFNDLDRKIKALGREVGWAEARVAKAKAAAKNRQDRDAEALLELCLGLPGGTLRTRASAA